MQNIGADNAGDAFYRYKMPKLQAKIEGRGNGIKTNIVNNVDIARSLERPPTYTLKYFGCDLGAQTKFDKDTGVSIVNGAHDAKKLSDILEGFIKKYVQCYKCGNPETVIKIKKECIHLKCKACGNISDVDMRDKLTTFIIKNPPDNKLSKAEAKVKRETKERMKEAEKDVRKVEKADSKKKRKDSTKKKSSSKGSDEDDAADDGDVEEGDVVDDDNDETVWKTDMSEDAVRKRQQEQLTAATAALVQQHLKIAEETEQANAKADSAEAATTDAGSAEAGEDEADDDGDDDMDEDDDDDDEELTEVQLLREYIESESAAYVAAVLEKSKVEGGLVGKMKLFYEALLGDCSGKYVERMQAKETYIAALAKDPSTQASQLIALEHFLTQVKPERMSEMPFILKMLFEEDLIDENIIVMWGEQKSVAKKHGVDAKSAVDIRAVAQRVIDWLQEDDDEESDDDDDEE